MTNLPLDRRPCYRLRRWHHDVIEGPWIVAARDAEQEARQALTASADAWQVLVATEASLYAVDAVPELAHDPSLYLTSAKRAHQRLLAAERTDGGLAWLPADVLAQIPQGAVPGRYLLNQIDHVISCARSLERSGGLINNDPLCRWVCWSAEPLLEACGFFVGSSITKRRTTRRAPKNKDTSCAS